VGDYTSHYFENPDRAKYQLTDLLNSQIQSLPLQSSVIDLGCGDLTVLRMIARMRPDLKLHGVDAGDLPHATNLNGISYTKADIRDFGTDEKFQLALAIDVLEHLSMPQHLIQLAARIVETGGWIYVTAPSVTKLLLFGDENFYGDYTHVRPFNLKGIKRLLEDNGFQTSNLNILGAGTSFKQLRLLYYIARGLISIDSTYINAAISHIGGTSVEALAKKVGGPTRALGATNHCDRQVPNYDSIPTCFCG
jgi:SAM-dependent methyltransferase